MKYEFGVMSSRYELESDDEIIAKVAMCFFMKTTAPVAIYSPIKCTLDSQEQLDTNYDYIQDNTEKFIKCLDSIKECVIGGLDE